MGYQDNKLSLNYSLKRQMSFQFIKHQASELVVVLALPVPAAASPVAPVAPVALVAPGPQEGPAGAGAARAIPR